MLGLVLVLALPAALGASAVAYYQHRQRGAAITRLHAALARHNSALAAEQAALRQLRDSLSQVTSAHVKLDSAMNTVVSESQQCLTLSCFDTTAVSAANASDAFGRTLRGISFPAAASSAVAESEKDAAANGQAWLYMSHAVSFSDYGDRATRAEKFGKAFDNGYSALLKSLNQVGAELAQRAATLNREAADLRRRGDSLNVPVNPRTLPAITSGPALT